LIIATLFLNFPFWILNSVDLPMSGSLPLYAVQVGVVSLLIATLFFVGPALAAQAAKRDVVENSLGSFPAYGVRFCRVLFLLAWTAKLIAWAELWPLHIMRPQGWSPIESGAIGIGVMGLVSTYPVWNRTLRWPYGATPPVAPCRKACCWPQSQPSALYASGSGRLWIPHRYVLSEADGRWSPPIHTLQPLDY